MKNIILLLSSVLLLSSYSLASESGEKLVIGGVDVGNGYVINSGFELKSEFLSEDAVLEHFNMEKASIHKGENSLVKGLIEKGRCAKKRVKVQKLHFISFYPSSKDKLLKKRYKGFVSVGLFNCKRPSVIATASEKMPKGSK